MKTWWWSVLAAALATSCGRTSDVGRFGVGETRDASDGYGAASSGGSSRGGSGGGPPVAPSGGAGPTLGDARANDGDSPDIADAGADGAALAEAARALIGFYDVWITAPDVSGCKLAGSSRLNLIVTDDGGRLAAHLFEDSHWSSGARTRMVLKPDEVVLVPDVTGDDTPTPRPELTFDWSASGFGSQGTAISRLACVDGSTLDVVTASARVSPDTTPPRLVAKPFTEIGRVFPYTHIGLSLTEPARLDSINQSHPIPDDIDLLSQAFLSNVENGSSIPIAYSAEPYFGPRTTALFREPESVVGLTFRAKPIGASDLAGNVAIADDRSYTVLSAGPIVSRVDFDDGPHPSVYGSATYVAPGTASGPCESGGCLVMEGDLGACDAPVPAEAPALVTRFAFSKARTNATLRYRVWTTHPDQIRIQTVTVQCQAHNSVSVQPLPAPEGGYGYASAWANANVGPCLYPTGRNPLIVTMPCIQTFGPVPPAKARLVIESLVLDDP
jgi:hypothetical protein